MAMNELLIFHGGSGGKAKGGSKMARRCVRYSRRSGVRRCTKFGGGLSGFADLGQAGTLRATLSSVQGVLVTGAIAAGGALATDEIFDKIGVSLNLTGYQRDAAKMALGLGLGIVIGKFLGKPKLAAAFAIGPVVAGALDIFHALMLEPASSAAGLGLVAVEPPLQLPAYSGVGELGAMQVGPGVPSWMMYPEQSPAYALG